MDVHVTAEHSPLPLSLPLGLLRKIAIIGAAILGCTVSAGAAMSEIFQIETPEAAAAAWPRNGFALNAIADEKLNETILTQQKSEQPASSGTAMSPEMKNRWISITDTALHAFKLEPLNASALRSIAMAADARGDTARAQKLMAHAVLFSRRDTAANNWQFTQALTAQNLPLSMRLIDRIMRENSSLRSRYLPVLIAGIGERSGFEAAYSLLQKKPLWEDEFWSTAANLNSLPSELASLRQILLKDRAYNNSVKPLLSADINLIRNLVRLGKFDAAQALEHYLTGRSKNVDANGQSLTPISNLVPQGTAFDMQLISNGDIQTNLNSSGTELIVQMAPNSIGVFAHQLIKPTISHFSMSSPELSTQSTKIFVRLTCAEIGNTSPVVELYFDVKDSTKIRQLEQNCRWYNIEYIIENKSQEHKVFNIKGFSH